MRAEPKITVFTWSGYDSADGTYLAFAPDVNTPRVTSRLNGIESQMKMEIPACPLSNP